jgi:DNA-binding NtrC family response regulator
MLPRLLIVDDLFGRTVSAGINEDRQNLCGQYLFKDITGDEEGKGEPQEIADPSAEVVFCRGQSPRIAVIGDYVENDLNVVIDAVGRGWDQRPLETPPWTMVLLDLSFYTGEVTTESDRACPGMPVGLDADHEPRRFFGLTILRALHEKFPDLPVVIFSSKSRTDVSREFAAAGALGFLDRGDTKSRLLLRQYVARHGLLPDDAGEIEGWSIPLLLTLRAARRAADSDEHILLLGPRGSGKELMARYIHRHSSRRRGKLVVVDSGTLSPTLYGSELFGHTRGAFTGADRERRGRIAEADRGDLFLDEIGNMTLDVQAGLLRVIEEHEVVPLGAADGRKVDVRVISATNEDLEKRVREGSFRADLLDRVRQGASIKLPSLDERRDDIPLLVNRFVREAESAYGALRRRTSADAIAKLVGASWPGNVRQLKTAINAAVSEHRDVEHFDESHVRVWSGESSEDGVKRPTTVEKRGIASVINAMTEIDFDDLAPSELIGHLPTFDRSFAEMVSRYLAAALRTQLRHSPEAPAGKLMIVPALALITGERDLAATKAYDLIIRLRHASPGMMELWETDPLLKQAYERAVAKRRTKKTA